jgi:hypothetical protein
MQYTICIDGDYNNCITGMLADEGGIFSQDVYDGQVYKTGNQEAYKIIRIYRYGRWLDFTIKTDSNLNFRGYKLDFDIITSKEQ